MQDATRTPSDAIALSLSDAAVRLGISPDAARKRLERGTLRGVKNHGRWTVYLEPDLIGDGVDAVSDQTLDSIRTPLSSAVDADEDSTGRHRTPLDAAPDDQRDTAGTPSESAQGVAVDHVGLVPLVELVTDLTRRNEALARENTEIATAAAIWQERARFLGERLAALEAGPTSAPEHRDAPENAPEAPQRVEVPQMGNEPLQEASFNPVLTEVQLATGWRRWFRRVMGYEG